MHEHADESLQLIPGFGILATGTSVGRPEENNTLRGREELAHLDGGIGTLSFCPVQTLCSQMSGHYHGSQVPISDT